jgi:cation transport protein ChaC
MPAFRCLVYIGMPDNPQFVGVQEPQALAEHIYRSKGPSGENKEYLYMLDEALLGLSPDSGDKHIHDLAARVRRIETDPACAKGRAVEQELQKVASGQSGDPQEETEKGGQ